MTPRSVAAIGGALRVWEDRPARPESLLRRLPPIVLTAAAFIVTAGTYRPFVGGDGTAGWFYSQTLYPLAIAGCVLVGLLPRWNRGSGHPLAGLPIDLATRVGLPGAGVLAAITAAVGWREWSQLLLAAAIGFGGALVISAGRSAVARLAGHLGVLLIMFAALAGTISTETSVRLLEGESVDVDGHTVELLGTEIISEDPLQAQATLRIDGAYELTPSVAVFPDRNLRLPEVSTRTRPWLDSQAVLRDVDADAGTLVTVLFRPWNQLVWWGVALMTLAALLALFNRGRDAGEPARAHKARTGSGTHVDLRP